MLYQYSIEEPTTNDENVEMKHNPNLKVEVNRLEWETLNTLPKKLSDVHCIAYASPFIIASADQWKINSKLQERIWNFVNYKDPVPMLLAGKGDTDSQRDKSVKQFAMEFATASMKKLKAMGVNAGIGSFVVMYKKEEIKRSPSGNRFISLRRPKKTKEIIEWYSVKHPTDKAIADGNRCMLKYHSKGIRINVAFWASRKHRWEQYVERIDKGELGQWLRRSKWYCLYVAKDCELNAGKFYEKNQMNPHEVQEASKLIKLEHLAVEKEFENDMNTQQELWL